MNKSYSTITNNYGQLISFFDDDYIGRCLIRDGIYDGETLEFIDRLLSQRLKNATILDIGANIGNHALAFSRLANQVYAFEPVPETYDLLEKNIDQNKINNILPFNFALSDSNDIAKIYLSDKNAGQSSLYQRESNQSGSVEVRLRNGDEVFEENNLGSVDLIKIDVEGHEPAVIKGLSATIASFKPIVILEWVDHEAKKVMLDENIFETVFSDYLILVLGTNHKRSYWQDMPFGYIRRKFHKIFIKRKPVIYKFHKDRNYANLILIPKNKLKMIDGLIQ